MGTVVYFHTCYACFHFINSLRPRQKGHNFADDTFKCFFVYEKVWISSSLKFVPKGPMNNIPALVQIMAWRRPGDRPLSEPMMVRLLTHICVTRPQCVKDACAVTKISPDNFTERYDPTVVNHTHALNKSTQLMYIVCHMWSIVFDYKWSNGSFVYVRCLLVCD